MIATIRRVHVASKIAGTVAFIAIASESFADPCGGRTDDYTLTYGARRIRTVAWTCGASRFEIACADTTSGGHACACKREGKTERSIPCEGTYCICNPASFSGACGYSTPPPGPQTCIM